MKLTLKLLAVVAGLILWIAFFGIPAHAQRSNTKEVLQFPGSTKAEKTANAQASCRSDIPCRLIFDELLASFPTGSMPSQGSNEIWEDYTVGNKTIPSSAAGSVNGLDITPKSVNGLQLADQFSGADACAKIAAAITALSSSGGVVDARNLKGAQACAANPFAGVTKPVTLLLDQVVLTTSVTISVPSKSLILGAGVGTTTTGGTRIVASANTVTPVVQFAGADATTNRVTNSGIAGMTITGVYLAAQKCLYLDHVTDISVTNVQFTECGNAEDVNDAYRVKFERVKHVHSGSGDTAATATSRVENRSNTSVNTEQVYFDDDCLWEGDAGGKEGIAIYFGPFTEQTAARDSKFDYGSTNPTHRIVVWDGSWYPVFRGNTVSAASITVAAAVLDITGADASHTTFAMSLSGNPVISTSSSIPAIRCDFCQWSTILGSTFTTGAGSNAGLVTFTSHSIRNFAWGLSKSQSTDTLILDSGTSNVVQPTSPIAQTFKTGTVALGTGSLAANTCQSASTDTVTGLTTADIFTWLPSADWSALTGYGKDGTLRVYSYATANTVNFKVCNSDPTNAVTVPAASVIYRVPR